MKKQNEYTFKHLVNSCIDIIINACSENEARQMLQSHVKNPQNYFLL